MQQHRFVLSRILFNHKSSSQGGFAFDADALYRTLINIAIS